MPSPTVLARLDTPNVRRTLVAGGVLGLLLGIETLVLHLTMDPLADVHAYYDAGSRLNAGLPLYQQAADTNQADFYRYPPLLAIAFRPLALLPFAAAAAIWEAFLVGCFVLTAIRLRPTRWTLVVLGMLALPTAWSLAIGQAQVAVTLLISLGAPWALALAANLKLLPALAAIWWLGRRDVRSFGLFVAWLIGFGVLQLVLEPAGTLAFSAFVGLDQVGEVNNRSLYGFSPVLWAIAVVVGVVVAWRLARTRYGWAAAVALSVLATPRLLLYQLSTLAAGLREPDSAHPADRPEPGLADR